MQDGFAEEHPGRTGRNRLYDHHFRDIHSVADFRRQLPVAPYEYFEPYLNESAVAKPTHCWRIAAC